MKKEDKNFLSRLRFIFVGIVAVGFVLIANLFYIQIQNGEVFRQQADGQYVAPSYNSFERGSIFFQEPDGSRISAAGQKSGYKISINPSSFSADPDEIYAAISAHTEISRDTFFSAVEKKDKQYAEILTRVNKDLAKTIKAELGSVVQLHTEKWRSYPLKGAGSHLLGFLAYRGDDFGGRYGLERVYENTLKRENTDIYTNFFARIFHNVQDFVDPEVVPEGDIVTTIDPKAQLFLEKEIAKIQDTWQSSSTGGIIIHPKTGAIYAMGAYPNFDNNSFTQFNPSNFRNPLVENVYEVGSIMKPLVVALGIDTGDVNTETLEYYDKGSVQVEDYTIKNFDGRGRGWVSVQDILNQSLNTGMVYITKRIKKQVFRDFFKNLGFQEKTGIDLPSEGSSLTANLKSSRDIEHTNISFGQGIAITPVAMVRALSVLANNGRRVDPHLVKKIEYTNGFSKTLSPEIENQKVVISPEAAGETSRLLVNVFDEYRGGEARLENYRIAAKTGTAQIPDPKGGYYDDRNLHSFFGYFPAYEPEFLVFLYTVHPKGVKYSSQTLIDPFRSIAKYLINAYDVAPDR